MSRATGCVALTGYCERQGVKYAFDLRFKGPPAPKQLPSSRRVAALLDDAKSLSVEVEEAGLLKHALARCTAWQCRVVPKVPSHAPHLIARADAVSVSRVPVAHRAKIYY